MNKKTYLVAKREYIENLRTKAFWIGIFIFPVIITAFTVVPTLLERTKGPRTYSVVDRSGWLLPAVENRAAMPDFAKVFRLALDRHREGGSRNEALPQELRAIGSQLDVAVSLMEKETAGLPESEREAERQRLEEEAVDGLASFMAGLGTPDTDREKLAFLPEEAMVSLVAMRESIRLWWKNLPPEEAKDLGGVSKSRYVRIEAPGTDEAALEELNGRITSGELFAYFVIGPDPVTGNEESRYVSNNLTDEDLKMWFADLASDEIRERRLVEKQIDKETAIWIQTPVRFEGRRVGAAGEEEVGATDQLRQWAPVAFVYVLWVAIFSISQSLLTNTVEEKSNRIIEVLLSSISPIELMAGKIAGIAATGLTVVASWVIFFILAVKILPGFLGGDIDIDLSSIASDPLYIGSFLVYFIAGYLFFAALLVGIGSVCNSLKEAQNLMSPITILLMLPLLAMVPIGKDPNGALAKALSYVPPFTPFVMMNRAAGPPTLVEYITTTILLIASIWVVLWASAKVFRIGILMTGKPPTFREMLKWVRAPVGQVPDRDRAQAATTKG